MLQIEISSQEFYNEVTGEFVNVDATILNLEHSLISISKWESKWKKPFLTAIAKGLNRPEFVDYVRCMTLNQKVDQKVYGALTSQQIEKIREYITDAATATTIYDRRVGRGGHSKDIITSEIIYYQMISFGIPFECEKWHLNRLLTLIHVCSVKGTPAQMSQAAIFTQNADLNAKRRMMMNSRG